MRKNIKSHKVGTAITNPFPESPSLASATKLHLKREIFFQFIVTFTIAI